MNIKNFLNSRISLNFKNGHWILFWNSLLRYWLKNYKLHFFTVTETLNSDKSDSNQQCSMWLWNASSICWPPCVSCAGILAAAAVTMYLQKCPMLLGTARTAVVVLNSTELKIALNSRILLNFKRPGTEFSRANGTLELRRVLLCP